MSAFCYTNKSTFLIFVSNLQLVSFTNNINYRSPGSLYLSCSGLSRLGPAAACMSPSSHSVSILTPRPPLSLSHCPSRLPSQPISIPCVTPQSCKELPMGIPQLPHFPRTQSGNIREETTLPTRARYLHQETLPAPELQIPRWIIKAQT